LKDRVNAALRELQAAVSAGALYPEGHPRILESLARCSEMLGEILDQRPEISVFAMGERVIFEDRVLADNDRLAAGLFRDLRRQGVDRITVRRGVQRPELEQLVHSLAPRKGEEAVPLRRSDHVEFGYLDGAVAAEAEEDDREREEKELRESAGGLTEVWGELGEKLRLDVENLQGIALLLGSLVSRSAAAVLPLAPLKRHDEYTFIHTINVAILSTALAESLGLGAKVVHEINVAALLHDVGKQLSPYELLNKPGRLTDDEKKILDRHPADGARILLSTPRVPDLAPVVAFEHHIRADGGGYPTVPRGWKLNLASRIVQVADIFDALRTARPYRDSLPVSKILQIMRGDVGPVFDADLLQVFIEKVVSRGLPEPAVKPV
jgi:putative nucleotidyltransferase with HDIG domain